MAVLYFLYVEKEKKCEIKNYKKKKTIVSENGDVKHNDVLKKTKFNASKHAST